VTALDQRFEARAVPREILDKEEIVVRHSRVFVRGARQGVVIDVVEAQLGHARIEAQAHIGRIAGPGARAPIAA